MAKVHLKLSRSTDYRYLLFLGLLVIVFIASRISFIDKIPASVYWDEASIGYNAYSISTDLRDEWGTYLPLNFRAFGEFKLPVYIYTTALSVRVLGLNALAVRLPAVLFSLGTIAVTYLLVFKLAKDKYLALISAFYLVFSPWFFIFSRTGYEATAGVFFMMLGFWCFIKSMDTAKYFTYSTPCYLLAIYSYNSMRVVIPLLFFL